MPTTLLLFTCRASALRLVTRSLPTAFCQHKSTVKSRRATTTLADMAISSQHASRTSTMTEPVKKTVPSQPTPQHGFPDVLKHQQPVQSPGSSTIRAEGMTGSIVSSPISYEISPGTTPPLEHVASGLSATLLSEIRKTIKAEGRWLRPVKYRASQFLIPLVGSSRRSDPYATLAHRCRVALLSRWLFGGRGADLAV